MKKIKNVCMECTKNTKIIIALLGVVLIVLIYGILQAFGAALVPISQDYSCLRNTNGTVNGTCGLNRLDPNRELTLFLYDTSSSPSNRKSVTAPTTNHTINYLKNTSNGGVNYNFATAYDIYNKDSTNGYFIPTKTGQEFKSFLDSIGTTYSTGNSNLKYDPYECPTVNSINGDTCNSPVTLGHTGDTATCSHPSSSNWTEGSTTTICGGGGSSSGTALTGYCSLGSSNTYYTYVGQGNPYQCNNGFIQTRTVQGCGFTPGGSTPLICQANGNWGVTVAANSNQVAPNSKPSSRAFNLEQ